MGVSGRFLWFLKALYQDNSCRVGVGDKLSEEFVMNTGLRWGCVFLPCSSLCTLMHGLDD